MSFKAANPLLHAFSVSEFGNLNPFAIERPGNFPGDIFKFSITGNRFHQISPIVKVQIGLRFLDVAHHVNIAPGANGDQPGGISPFLQDARGEGRVVVAITCFGGKKYFRGKNIPVTFKFKIDKQLREFPGSEIRNATNFFKRHGLSGAAGGKDGPGQRQHRDKGFQIHNMLLAMAIPLHAF
jgi:hypothetical protein